MTGASIVRWEARDRIVLSVHGAFDGASAWALRLQMDECDADEFLVDLTHAEEACEFAASVLAAWARERRRVKRVAFRPGAPEHARLLHGFGLEVAEEVEPVPALALSLEPSPLSAPSVEAPLDGEGAAA
jgi:anti-anti-sigma regulatory factor